MRAAFFGGIYSNYLGVERRQVNEFLWDSTSPDDFLEHLASSAGVDVLLCTHTGIHWQREFVPLVYDHQRLAREMGAELLPEQFVETVLTGGWTSCVEILPAKERPRGKF